MFCYPSRQQWPSECIPDNTDTLARYRVRKDHPPSARLNVHAASLVIQSEGISVAFTVTRVTSRAPVPTRLCLFVFVCSVVFSRLGSDAIFYFSGSRILI